jgi:hypothetical protein
LIARQAQVETTMLYDITRVLLSCALTASPYFVAAWSFQGRYPNLTPPRAAASPVGVAASAGSELATNPVLSKPGAEHHWEVTHPEILLRFLGKEIENP